jgi:hypothetical protein
VSKNFVAAPASTAPVPVANHIFNKDRLINRKRFKTIFNFAGYNFKHLYLINPDENNIFKWFPYLLFLSYVLGQQPEPEPVCCGSGAG